MGRPRPWERSRHSSSNCKTLEDMGLRTATKVLLLSDFNLGSLAGYLENAHEGPAIATTIAPFAELGTVLHNPDHEVWSKTHDALLIWTTPSSAIASFQAALDFR